jgi:hypothetical protein
MMKKAITAIATGFVACSTLAAISSTQVSQMDKDQDGQVSRAEYVGFFSATFPQKDQNKDGVLTPDEFPMAVPFNGGDADKDGKLTLAEYESIFVKQFDKAHDKNKDGVASGDELSP